jgi:hypothetical protein
MQLTSQTSRNGVVDYLEEMPMKKTCTPSLVGLGLIFGGGIGIVFGGAFGAPGIGLIYGAGVGLVVGAALHAMKTRRQDDESVQMDDDTGRR